MSEDDKISVGPFSDGWQFCGATFNEANQLSLHYKEKIRMRWEKKELIFKKKMREHGLLYMPIYAWA
jgi:hypothetical protein